MLDLNTALLQFSPPPHAVTYARYILLTRCVHGVSLGQVSPSSQVQTQTKAQTSTWEVVLEALGALSQSLAVVPSVSTIARATGGWVWVQIQAAMEALAL